MDFGYPQNLSPEILKLYITQEDVRSPFSSKSIDNRPPVNATLQVTGAVGWWQGKRRPAMQAQAELNDNQKESLQLYGKIERVIADSAKSTTGSDTDPGRWQDIEGSWVLTPSRKEPVAVVHFIGGVFVEATPQLTYRLFLERLCERGYVVIATPYPSGFDHLRIVEVAQFKFDRCLRATEVLWSLQVSISRI